MELKAVSDVYGKIEELLLVIEGSKSGVRVDEVRDQFGRILEAFRDRHTILVLGNFSPAVGESLVREYGGQTVKAIPAALDLEGENCRHDDWIQDPFCVLNGPHRLLVLLKPFYFPKRENRFLADQLSHGYGALLRATRYHLEGGNLLVGDDFLVVGMDTFERNRLELPEHLRPPDRAREFLEDRFRELFGMRYLIWAGAEEPLDDVPGLRTGKERRQPLYHLDMYLTLGGSSFAPDRQGDELILVGQVSYGEGMDPRKDDVKGLPPGDPRWAQVEALNHRLDQVAAFFREHHLRRPGPRFQVERLPLQVVFGERGPYLHSFNNCLVECYQGIRRVYLPDYRLAEHDPGSADCGCSQCRAVERFRSLGFRVEMVNDSFDLLARRHGSLHCITKVLRRSPY